VTFALSEHPNALLQPSLRVTFAKAESRDDSA
jgi:hypothetical protein